MKQRVLLLSTVHPATDPRIFYKIAPSLAVEYEVFCALPHAGRGANSSLTAISLPRFERLLTRLLFCHPVMLWKCLRLKPDLVHIFVPELIPAAFLFQWMGAKVIYEVQENLFKKFAIKKFNKALIYRKLFKYFDRIARRQFHLIFTEKAYLDEYRHLNHPYAIIQNFVSLPFIDLIQENEEANPTRPEFFYAGVISGERCFDVLILALVKLKERYFNFHVHLFGPVRIASEKLSTLSGYAQVSKHLTFYGYQDQKVALRYARRCMAGIALLKPVADYPDSFTTKLFEYMALGIPVITSDFPLYKQVVEHSECGFCISPYDDNMLYEKLVWVIENREAASEMGLNGRKSAEKNYNWTSEKSSLLSFYRISLHSIKAKSMQ
ncbi:glycosyltransferase [Dyadobacter arcticus]|uniref:Glycosyltransferase involved in cell wall biosynthesis n=1 Tax=Dyadobacter arcticus TaxID=1078754 RepID=A0ABX0UWJ7_9BACT|nr:glycosyltransferase [Dyadobacter arcticus]NIJ55975.1 glycosyltransferase involved in cell wall biosynthesis [Dyadobacter arcticus]